MNWQGITTPDGLIISMFGPVEGRRHDATMLSLSGVLDKMENNLILNFLHLRGHSLWVPSMLILFTQPGSSEAIFNSSMSSDRESVEWSFHIIKSL
ncbi:hypothetical protein THRCLA_22506 [Thraustotheca clavata]|uniref:DDE Tnp4 domain-containing protein n=1 Tax=Thraustotheca clavata TaxID=74557 RepID=A0A1V9YYS0_9STRA|nr:hypothetical protein THRCLA_22506 [Thraustotheca clavata]